MKDKTAHIFGGFCSIAFCLLLIMTIIGVSLGISKRAQEASAAVQGSTFTPNVTLSAGLTARTTGLNQLRPVQVTIQFRYRRGTMKEVRELLDQMEAELMAPAPKRRQED